MTWTRDAIEKHMTRKEGHVPRYDLGREVSQEVKIMVQSQDVRVADIANILALGYQGMGFEHADLYEGRYQEAEIFFDPKNKNHSEFNNVKNSFKKK